MFYSNYDCDFLRLCGLCRYIPTDLDERFDSIIFRKEVISYMQDYKFIKMQSDKKSFKLTEKGRKALWDMGWGFNKDSGIVKDLLLVPKNADTRDTNAIIKLARKQISLHKHMLFK